MQIRGRIKNGVVVLDEDVSLHEDTVVTVHFPEIQQRDADRERRRVVLPLVHTDNSGSLNLTNDRIAEILNDEDASYYMQLLQSQSESQTVESPGKELPE